MEQEWRSIVDAEGRKGLFRLCQNDASQADVKLESGELLKMPAAYAVSRPDGMLQFDRSFSKLLEIAGGSELVIPVVHEQLVIKKRSVEREHVRIKTTVSSTEKVVNVPLVKEELQVERVPIGRTVDTKEEPRQEGDTLVVPVYEEVLVVEKRLLLREEIRVTRVRREEQATQRVTLRGENVAIERSDHERSRSEGEAR